MSTATQDRVYAEVDSEISTEDLVIPDVTTGSRTGDEIEAANSFEDIPPGERVLVVRGFGDAPKTEAHRVLVNGRVHTFYATTVAVEFGEVGGRENARIRDYFLLPPSNPDDLPAYYEGKAKEEDKTGGFNASKFLHFIDRLGWPFLPGGHLPDEARKLSNWKGRTVVATVQAGKPWTDKDGNTKPGYNRIKLFSYRPAASTASGASQQASRPAPQAGAAPTGRPSQVAASGLNDI